MILAGDIGGTKTVLALFDTDSRDLKLVRDVTEPSREAPSLESIIERFLKAGPPVKISSACFGVAGAVVEGKSTATNLPWVMEEKKLGDAIPSPRVKLLNDLEAAAWGVMNLPDNERATIQPGTARRGNMALIAAGTGLGEALMIWDGKQHQVVGSEGGHADFAPRTPREVELFNYLHREWDHVSYERVLSGPGLWNVYRFVRDTSPTPEPDWLKQRIETGDKSAVVSEVGLNGQHPLCVEAVDLFMSIYGAEAGNLALKGLTVGGVYIGGGIAPKMRKKVEDGTFVNAFRAKGRFAKLMESMTIQLALNPRAPLLGAALHASNRLH